MRKIADSDFVGKTVKSIDTSAINVLKFTFTDDTSAELWAEEAVFTAHGNIPGIFLEDHPSADVSIVDISDSFYDENHSACSDECDHE